MRKINTICFCLIMLCSTQIICSCNGNTSGNKILEEQKTFTLIFIDEKETIVNHEVICDVVYVPEAKDHPETALVPLLFVMNELGFDLKRQDSLNASITVGNFIYRVSVSDAKITLDGYDPEVNFLVGMAVNHPSYIQPAEEDIWVDIDTVRSVAEHITERRLARDLDTESKTIKFIWIS